MRLRDFFGIDPQPCFAFIWFHEFQITLIFIGKKNHRNIMLTFLFVSFKIIRYCYHARILNI